MLISAFKVVLCPIREDCSQLTGAQEGKKMEEWKAGFLFYPFFSLPFHSAPPNKWHLLTYCDGLDTFGGGVFPCAGDSGAALFSQVPLQFGAFSCLLFRCGTPSNGIPTGGQTQSWEKKAKEYGLSHCPRKRLPPPSTEFSRLLHSLCSSPSLSIRWLSQATLFRWRCLAGLISTLSWPESCDSQ